jgi:hypothetical protein
MSNPVVTNSSASLNAKTLLTKEGLAANQPRCIASRSLTPFSIPDNAGTYIEFDTEVIDIGSMFDVGDPTKIIIPEDGFYYVLGTMGIEEHVTGYRSITLEINSTYDLGTINLLPIVGDNLTVQLGAIYQFITNDFIKLSAYQNSGGALNSSPGAPPTPANDLDYNSSLMVVKLF